MSMFARVLKAPFALKKPAPRPQGVLLRAVLISDIHITKARYRRLLLTPALKKLGRFSPDALVIAGDCTDTGSPANWRALAADMKKHCPVKNVIAALGNHDTWESYACPHDYVSAKENYLRYAGDIMGARPENVYFTREVCGVPFIILGSEDTGVCSTLGDAQLLWLEGALAAAARARPAGPLIVVHHSPMNHTHGVGENEHGMGIAGEASEKLLRVLDRYENVIYVCGHIHFGLQTQGRFATVQKVGAHVASVCLPGYEYGELFNGKYASPGYPLPGTGLVMDVYADRAVFTGAAFPAGRALPAFTFTVPFQNTSCTSSM